MVEDEILITMEEIDSSSRLSKSEETKFNTEKAKIESLKQQFKAEQSEIEKELSAVKEIRNNLIQNIDREIYHQYMTLIEKFSGLAVAEAKDEICLGCNMNIPPQLFVELKKNEEILLCPQCQKILYFKNTT